MPENDVEVTPAMIEAGMLAIYGRLLNWEDSSIKEQEKAIAEAFVAMWRLKSATL